MKHISIYFLLLLVFSTCKYEEPKKESKSESKKVNIMAYYVPSNSLEVSNLPLDKLTHIIYSFTEVIDHQMVFTSDRHSKSLEELTKVCEKYPDLKVMVACGGWRRMGRFRRLF